MLRLPALLLLAFACAQFANAELQVVDGGETLQIRAKRAAEPVFGSGEGSGEVPAVVEGSGDVVLKEGSGEGSGAEPVVANTAEPSTANSTSDDSLLSNILKDKKAADEIAV